MRVVVKYDPPYSFGSYLNDSKVGRMYDDKYNEFESKKRGYDFVEKKNIVENIVSQYPNTNWNADMVRSLTNRINDIDKYGFYIDDIAHVISDESSFDKYADNGTYVGPMQMSPEYFNRFYGDTDGARVYSEYKNRTRSDEGIQNDISTYLNFLNNNIKTERDKMTYGRLKVNQYAPNASLDDKVSSKVWNKNIAKEIKIGRLNNNLKLGTATYRDLMNSYDERNQYDNGGVLDATYKEQINRIRQPRFAGWRFKDGGIYIKEENRGKFTEQAQRVGMTTKQFTSEVLENPNKYSPTTVKRARFSRNIGGN